MEIFKNIETEFSEKVKNTNEENFNHITTFEINNVPLSFGNSLRRCILSNIPTVAFNDEWVDNELSRKIVVENNTSGIHNEFLSHRISLIPIYLGEDILKICTKFDIQHNRRSFDFDNNRIPYFEMRIKNNRETRKEQGLSDTNSNIIVTNNNFKYYYKDSLDSSNYDYPPENKIILPDLYTGDHIILNILKPNVLDDNMGEEINLIAKPTIGIGKQHSRYCPVGTVSFQLLINEDLVDSVFEKKIEYMNKERLNKKLTTLSSQEVDKLKKSFNLLDKERVFKKNGFGNANSFKFCVESIGMLESNQIIYDGLSILELKILDILNSINISQNENQTFNINLLNDKIQFQRSNDLLDGLEILMNNENHTIGNLISEYLKSLYIGTDAIDTNILKFASYSMPHPLKESINIKMKIKDIDDDKLNSIYQYIYYKIFEKHSIKKIENRELLENNIYLIVLINCIKIIHKDIQLVKKDFSNKINIDKASFKIEDSDDFINVLPQFPLSLNNIIKEGSGKQTNIIFCQNKSNILEILVEKQTDLAKESAKDVTSEEAGTEPVDLGEEGVIEVGEKIGEEQIAYLDDPKIIGLYPPEYIKLLKQTNSNWVMKKDSLARIQEKIESFTEQDIIITDQILTYPNDDKVLIYIKNAPLNKIPLDITYFFNNFKPKKKTKTLKLKKK
jgi:DNA-directed RNA polymerase subunit L